AAELREQAEQAQQELEQARGNRMSAITLAELKRQLAAAEQRATNITNRLEQVETERGVLRERVIQLTLQLEHAEQLRRNRDAEDELISELEQQLQIPQAFNELIEARIGIEELQR